MEDRSNDTCHEPVFQRLFKEHARHLRNFLRYKGAEEEQAKDLMQEAFLRLWKACKKVPFHKAKSFLFTVAHNLIVDEQRHLKHVRAYEQLPQTEQDHQTPDKQLEGEEFKRRMQQAIANLPENQRLVFLMNRVDGLTYAAIAERLGISVKAVEKRMHKALSELRKQAALIVDK